MDDGLDIVALGGRRQDDVSGSGTDVFLEVAAPGECAGALEHDVYLQGLPR
jgi:hypothetical protein